MAVAAAAGVVVAASASARPPSPVPSTPEQPITPPAVLAEPEVDSATLARLREDVRAVRATGVVGVLGEVDTGAGRLPARSGVADRATEAAMPLNGYFRIGSTTKTFVATVVLQLAGEGRLALDDTVEKWLPGVVRGNGNDGREVTVRQLLQHTSGIPEYLRPATSPRQWRRERLRTWQPGQLVALAMKRKPSFAPGAEWGYSNTNYVLAGMIIRRVTGYDWAEEVRQRVLTPLALRHTVIPGADPYLPDPHARAYTRFTPDAKLTDVTTHDQTLGDAAGAMISTTGDLNRFFRALLGGRLLAPAQLAEMRKTVPAKALQAMGVTGAAYGLGLMYRPLSCGGGYWGHGGDEAGFSTRAGVAGDGRRSVAVEVTSRSPADLKALLRTDRALSTLVDHALCGTG
ncbi:beta-lactamase family protein [Nonomuraea zeae]|uniref:Beta-lactamase family protein n=2 Tax=Nonomuraea zeae TaxID=1642303 RepID=A0A5S4H3Z0_9ACTN|nr:beta-lactamase family protein [Nonomuraea zeae]